MRRDDKNAWRQIALLYIEKVRAMHNGITLVYFKNAVRKLLLSYIFQYCIVELSKKRLFFACAQ